MHILTVGKKRPAAGVCKVPKYAPLPRYTSGNHFSKCWPSPACMSPFLSPTKLIRRFDEFAMVPHMTGHLSGLHRFAVEFWMFGLKEARAGLFASHKFRGLGLPRYDLLLLIAIGIQVWMLVELKHIKARIRLAP